MWPIIRVPSALICHESGCCRPKHNTTIKTVTYLQGYLIYFNAIQF
jgi:hypothetical protein